jgi:adenylylsulfate kinase
MHKKVATNVFWQDGVVTREDRIRLLCQTGLTIWFTGLSGSGKTTLAIALEQQLLSQDKASYRLDGDNMRFGINKNLGFSAEDRRENIRRVGEVSKVLADAGIIALSSFISPYREDRDSVRALHERTGLRFLEVYVDCTLETAESRDPKGLYKKARRGEIKNFTGIDDPYEAPLNADIHLRSDQMTVAEEVMAVMTYLHQNDLLNPKSILSERSGKDDD